MEFWIMGGFAAFLFWFTDAGGQVLDWGAERFGQYVVRPMMTAEQRVLAAEQEANRALWAVDPEFAAQVTDMEQGSRYLEVLEVAHRVRTALLPHVVRCEVAGSLRRGVPEPGDADLLVIPRAAREERRWMNAALIQLADSHTLRLNEKDRQIALRVSGVGVHVVLSEEALWGMDMLTLTGSRAFNRMWEQRAATLGLQTYEGRLGRWKGSYHVTWITEARNMTEEQVLALLGLPEFTDPRSREYAVLPVPEPVTTGTLRTTQSDGEAYWYD